LTLATTLAACGGGETPVEGAPQPSGTPATDVPPAGSGAAEATPPPNTSPSGSAAAVAPPAPAAKPAKEKWVGKFSQQFAGETKDAWETENKAKFAKEKDTKKHDEAAKKKEAELAEVVIENTADTHVFSVKGKASHKVKFEAGKGDDKTLTIKLGLDETTKKDLKGAEVTITFTDDNTFEVADPWAKDPKKAQKLVFKRQ
jgi:hypothetical protein